MCFHPLASITAICSGVGGDSFESEYISIAVPDSCLLVPGAAAIPPVPDLYASYNACCSSLVLKVDQITVSIPCAFSASNAFVNPARAFASSETFLLG